MMTDLQTERRSALMKQWDEIYSKDGDYAKMKTDEKGLLLKRTITAWRNLCKDSTDDSERTLASLLADQLEKLLLEILRKGQEELEEAVRVRREELEKLERKLDRQGSPQQRDQSTSAPHTDPQLLSVLPAASNEPLQHQRTSQSTENNRLLEEQEKHTELRKNLTEKLAHLSHLPTFQGDLFNATENARRSQIHIASPQFHRPHPYADFCYQRKMMQPMRSFSQLPICSGFDDPWMFPPLDFPLFKDPFMLPMMPNQMEFPQMPQMPQPQMPLPVNPVPQQPMPFPPAATVPVGPLPQPPMPFPPAATVPQQPMPFPAAAVPFPPPAQSNWDNMPNIASSAMTESRQTDSVIIIDSPKGADANENLFLSNNDFSTSDSRGFSFFDMDESPRSPEAAETPSSSNNVPTIPVGPLTSHSYVNMDDTEDSLDLDFPKIFPVDSDPETSSEGESSDSDSDEGLDSEDEITDDEDYSNGYTLYMLGCEIRG